VSHAKLSASPSASEAPALNCNSSGAAPLAGVAVGAAVGGVLAGDSTSIPIESLRVAPSSSVTVRTTL
jgi:hypothetical protein